MHLLTRTHTHTHATTITHTNKIKYTCTQTITHVNTTTQNTDIGHCQAYIDAINIHTQINTHTQKQTHNKQPDKRRHTSTQRTNTFSETHEFDTSLPVASPLLMAKRHLQIFIPVRERQQFKASGHICRVWLDIGYSPVGFSACCC